MAGAEQLGFRQTQLSGLNRPGQTCLENQGRRLDPAGRGKRLAPAPIELQQEGDQHAAGDEHTGELERA